MDTITRASRETYKLLRWARKRLESAGREPTYEAIIGVILVTDTAQRTKEMEILEQAYAFYEEDSRRLALNLMALERAGWKCSTYNPNRASF